MNKKTEQALLAFATKIGTTVEHLYEVLTKQAKVWAFKAIIECLIWAFVFAILLIVSCMQHFVPNSPQYPNDICTWETLCLILSWALTTIIGFIVVINASDKISDVYQAFVNPEYWAIERILEIF